MILYSLSSFSRLAWQVIETIKVIAVFTIEEIKHNGQRIAPAPLAPPSFFLWSGVSRLGTMRGSRHRNSAITTTNAEMDLRGVGHFLKIRNLEKNDNI